MAHHMQKQDKLSGSLSVCAACMSEYSKVWRFLYDEFVDFAPRVCNQCYCIRTNNPDHSSPKYQQLVSRIKEELESGSRKVICCQYTSEKSSLLKIHLRDNIKIVSAKRKAKRAKCDVSSSDEEALAIQKIMKPLEGVVNKQLTGKLLTKSKTAVKRSNDVTVEYCALILCGMRCKMQKNT